MRDPFGPGFGHPVFFILQGLISFFILLVVVGLIFLLVRFLLTATTAAKLYIANNSPAATPAAAAPTAPAPTESDAPTVVKPATKPRTPKAPPAE